MRAIALALTISMGACSTTSTIHRMRGPAYEGEIVSSDPDALHVTGDDHQVYEVPREEVTDIDHPGNVLFVVGASIVAFAALIAISIKNDTHSTPENRDAATAVGVVYGLPGVIMMAYGGATYLISRGNARAFDNAKVPMPGRPPYERYHPQFPPPPLAPPPPAPSTAPPATSPAPAPWAPPVASPPPAPPTGASPVAPADRAAAPAEAPKVPPPAPAAPKAPPPPPAAPEVLPAPPAAPRVLPAPPATPR